MQNFLKKQLISFKKQFGVDAKIVFFIVSLLIILSGTASVTSLNKNNQDNRSVASEPTRVGEEMTACLNAGGQWLEFSNGCADSCAYAADPTSMCTMVITNGCDCGPDKCWDRDYSCVPNPVPNDPRPSETPYPSITPISSEPTITPPLEPSAPPITPIDPVCPTADIASSLYPNGYISSGSDLPIKDCCVDGYDRSFLITQFFTNNSLSDINNDGKIDLWDYSILVSQWQAGCLPNGQPI